MKWHYLRRFTGYPFCWLFRSRIVGPSYLFRLMLRVDRLDSSLRRRLRRRGQGDRF